MDVRTVMRWTAAAAGIAAVCVGAGSASADVLPPPPVVTPPPLPVPVPTLPAPPLPALPVPTPPSAPSTPSVPSTPSIPSTQATAPSPGVATSTSPIAGVASSKSLAAGGSASGSGSGSASQRSSSSRTGGETSIARLHSSRPWIAAHGPSARRRTTLTFRLREASRVVFTVRQVSPVCRVVGLFTVRGHAGVNKVPFTSRLRGRTLPSGTYQISARTRGGGTVLRVIVVVVESGIPSPTELESARRSNVCGARAALASNGLGAAGPGSGTREQQRTAKTGGTAASAPSSGGVAAASKTVGGPYWAAHVSKNITDPLVIMALAAAALLLGFASLPEETIPDPRLGYVLARHRVGVAFAGVGALAAAVIELAFG